MGVHPPATVRRHHRRAVAAVPKRGRRWRPAAVAGIAALLIAATACTHHPAQAQKLTTDPVLVVAGDIACSPSNTVDICEDDVTADLVEAQHPTTVVAAGDLQYENGSLPEFQQAYDKTWGRFKSITKPAVGNHEYRTANAQGFRDYWGKSSTQKLYGGFERGAWKIYILDSNCTIVSCAAQADYLRRDQAADPHKCVMAVWHHPLYASSVEHSGDAAVRPLWDALYAARADVIVNGHGHVSAIWEKLTPSGVRASNGIKEFESGGGGKNHHTLRAFDSRIDGTKRFNDVSAVLRFDLHATSYDYRYVTPKGDRFADTRACV